MRQTENVLDGLYLQQVFSIPFPSTSNSLHGSTHWRYYVLVPAADLPRDLLIPSLFCTCYLLDLYIVYALQLICHTKVGTYFRSILTADRDNQSIYDVQNT